MRSLGFQQRTINWFIDYLTERKQVTDVNGTVSEMKDMLLGVPQGSILGPILFLIYVNDINKADSRCTFTKFADDTTMLTTGESLSEAVNAMNSALINIDTWFRRNKLNLNPSKTRYMIFNHKTDDTKLVKIGPEFLERVWEKGEEKSFKLVGIEIDEDLSWKHHIAKIGKKVNSAIYGLSKVASGCKK